MSFPETIPEPRKVFLGLLIQRLADIEDRIYLSHKRVSSIDAMKGIIDTLDEQSKKSLETEYNLLCKYEAGECDNKEIQEVYRNLTNHLHKTYLQEVNIGIVPASALPSKETPPGKEPIPARVSARL